MIALAKKRKIYKATKERKIITFFFLAILIIANIFLIHNILLFKNIETLLCICIITILLIMMFITIILSNKAKRKSKRVFTISLIAIILFTSVLLTGSFVIKKMYNKIYKISTNYTTHSTSIVTLNSNKANNIDDIKDNQIGILNDKSSIEGYEIPNQIIKDEKLDEKKVASYNSYVEMIQELLDGNIEYIFLPTNYTVMFSSIEGFEELANTTKIIYTRELEKESEKKAQPSKNLTEPFSILLMGVDSEYEGIENGSFNGDALLVLTFNPETLNTTILSIPRDSYIPITCMNNRRNKITNAGWYGETCVVNSVEKFLDIDIDYYFKINFKGVVSLVDAVDGIDIDVPYSFCEQNSNREWGRKTIFVDAGKQHLNGEQALAYARHRKVTDYMVYYCGSKYVKNANYWNDFIRGEHQQEVISGILNKLSDIKSFNTIEEILDSISNNTSTNMSIDTILSLYNIGKDILSKSNNANNSLSMQRLYLTGYDATIYDYNFIINQGTKLNLYNYIIYEDSLEEVIQAMKENLGLSDIKPNKSFSFSVEEPYTPYIIGQGQYSKIGVTLVPNWIGKDISKAEAFAKSYGITLKIDYIEGSSSYSIGQITSQSVPAGTDIDGVRNITLKVVNSIKKENNIKEDDDINNDTNDKNKSNNNNNNSNNNKENNNSLDNDIDNQLPEDLLP